MGDSTSVVDNASPAVQGLRNNLINYLQSPRPQPSPTTGLQPLQINATNTPTGTGAPQPWQQPAPQPQPSSPTQPSSGGPFVPPLTTPPTTPPFGGPGSVPTSPFVPLGSMNPITGQGAGMGPLDAIGQTSNQTGSSPTPTPNIPSTPNDRIDLGSGVWMSNDASQGIYLPPGGQFLGGMDPVGMHPQALATLKEMYPGMQFIPIPGRGFALVPMQPQPQLQASGQLGGSPILNQLLAPQPSAQQTGPSPVQQGPVGGGSGAVPYGPIVNPTGVGPQSSPLTPGTPVGPQPIPGLPGGPITGGPTPGNAGPPTPPTNISDPRALLDYARAMQQYTQSQQQAPATGGLTPGDAGGFFGANMNTVSPAIVQSPWGPVDVPDVNGEPVQQGTTPPYPTGENPMGVPSGVTPWTPGTPVTPPPGWELPPSTGSGGPVGPGGPTGQGPGPVFTGTQLPGGGVVNTTPGQSPFDQLWAQLPPDMQRIIMGSPALIGEMEKIRNQFSAQQTQSVDQLGGANSAFFQNMMAQLQPAFDTQRGLSVAAAKEASGNLTGSGYANTVGNALNRSLGQEQATLADYASRGMQTEIQRQLSQAGLGLQADELGQRGSMFNVGNEFSRQSGNANAINDVMKQQGTMDLQRLLTQYGAASQTNQGNAANYANIIANLLGQRGEVAVEGGIGSALAPIISILPFLL